MEIFVPLWIVCGLVGAVIGSRKNAAGGGFVVGFLFGPLGVIAAFALDGRPKCPHCGTRLETGASICTHCRTTQSSRAAFDGDLIRFACPGCRCLYSRPDCDAGMTFHCEHCGAEVTVPGGIKPITPKAPSKLAECPDCGKQVSRRAATCPGCGCPL